MLFIKLRSSLKLSTESHGSNLVTDYQYYNRIQNSISQFVNILNTNFDQVFNLVQFYSNINNLTAYNANSVTNLQSISSINIEIDVEGTKQIVDLLGKKIQQQKNNLTIQKVLTV